MRIVYLAPFGTRPKGTLVARMLPLAVELQRLGHEIKIVAPPHTNPEDSGVVETARGIRIVNIRLAAGGKAFSAAQNAWRMYRAALREKPDLIHLFKPKGYGGLAMMLMIILKRLGVCRLPLLVDCDDWEGKGGMNDLHPYSPAEKRLFQFQEDWLPPRAAGGTVASRTLQTKVWGMGIDPARVLYLPNCVDDVPSGDGAKVREELGIAPDAPVLLLYTRFFEFDQEKLHFLFEEIYRRVPGVRFLVVGKGRNGEENLLVRTARERGFDQSLVMGGWLEPLRITDYLAAGDVALYPFSDTLINRSKCPAKLTELLRAGVATVADNVGQLTEYIKPGVSGLLCTPDDWQEMADNAVALLKDPERRLTLGRTGREYLLDRFNWREAAGRLNNFYGRCLPGKGR